jgi:tetratricopeptide (TPR) repeat protein
MSLHPDGWRCAVGSVYTTTWVLDPRPLTPELRLKRDAQNLVLHLVRKPLLKDELLDQLERMKTISEPLRREARAVAAGLEIPSSVYVLAAMDIVIYRDRPEDEYRRALRWLEEANRLSPDDGEVLEFLGLALYRLGRFKEAAVTLESAFKINHFGYFSDPAADLVFLAMAQHRLGQHEEARKTLARARDPKCSPQAINPQLWQEAEALIEGKMNEPNKQR